MRTNWTKEMYMMAGLTGVSVVAAVASYIQHKKTAGLLKKTVTELAKTAPVEIEKDIVDEVVQEALEMKVDNQVDEILEETKKEIRSDISKTVNAAVVGQMSQIRDDVAKEFTDRVSRISEDEVKDLVVQKSVSQIQNKIDSQFDDIYRQYNKRLDEINSMYTRIVSKAPNLSAIANVNPGIHVQW